ncbi:large ribosomal subunit protein mL52-like [Rhopilema esculentum]|uniref:large ribosomal subunit protein mL52-like n=1 Tax=Rhopilema esculentum TaxID=499914 RepID=UPI0031DEF832
MAAGAMPLQRCLACAISGRTPKMNVIINATRQFSLTSQILAGGAFRRKQGKAEDSLAYGPLTDTPDWTYLDGSVPPLSKRQLDRQKKRIETANRVVTILKQINEAKKKSQDKKHVQTENSL